MSKKKRFRADTADTEFYLAKMRQHGLRVTEPRLAILEVLRRKHGPFTVEEIYQFLEKNCCDLATLYRSLASLEKIAVLVRCDFGDGLARFELAHTDDRHDFHHHHVICKKCKKIEVLEDCELGDLNAPVVAKGFLQVSHTLEFFGICLSCQL